MNLRELGRLLRWAFRPEHPRYRQPFPLDVSVAQLAQSSTDGHQLASLLRRAVSEDVFESSDASAALTDLLGRAAGRWQRLDERIRRATDRWERGTDDLMYALRKPDRHLLVFFVCHASGFVREAALRYAGRVSLESQQIGWLLPLVLIRANDWVPSVRNRSHETLDALLNSVRPEDLEPAVELLGWLRRPDLRGQPSAAAEAVEKRLLQGEAGPARRRLVESQRSQVRRVGFELLSRADELDSELMRRGLGDPDPLVATAVLRQLEDLPRQGTDLYRLGLESVQGSVRCRALRWWHRSAPAEATEAVVALDLLFARGAGLRNLARWIVRERDVGWAVERGFDLFSSRREGRHRVGALAGLWELSVEAERLEPLARSSLSSPTVALRLAAVRVLCDRCGGLKAPEITRLLRDPSPRVVGEVSRRVTLSSVSSEELQGIVGDPDSSGHNVRGALVLLMGQERWAALEALLRALEFDGDQVAIEVRWALSLWLERTVRGGVPPDLTKERLANRWRQVARRVDRDQRSVIEFILR